MSSTLEIGSTSPASPSPETASSSAEGTYEINPKTANPSRSNCTRVALVLNFICVTGLLLFFSLYAAGCIPLENFTGMIGSSVFITTTTLLFLLSTVLLVLSFRTKE